MSTTQTQQITPRAAAVDRRPGRRPAMAAEAVLKSMLASGWTEDVAIEAMESTLRGHLEQKAQEQGLPAAVPVPDPRLEEAPLYLDAGDRRVCVLQTMHNPRVVVFGDLLSDEECEALIELAQAAPGALAHRGDQDRRRGGQRRPHQQRHVLPARRERAGRAHRGAHRAAAQLAGGERRRPADPALPPGRRIQAALRLLRSRRARHAHHPQARRPARRHAGDVPGRAGKGRRHHLSRRAAWRWRPSAATPSSSATSAPIPPPGRLHGGAPVLAGEKWIATKWLRERRFE